MEKYGIKDIYQASLKVVTPMEINGTTYQKDDTLLWFDNIQEISFSENRQIAETRGGWNNRALVQWVTTQEVACAMALGVVNKIAYGLMNNAKLMPMESQLINQIENLEVIDGIITCCHLIDNTAPIKVRLIENGQATNEILNYTIKENTIILEQDIPNNVLVDYWFEYNDKSEFISIGDRDLNGYLKFFGKFYYVDEFSGKRKTGIIDIPKLRVNSSFSIQFGRNVNPFISILNFQALPNGIRGDGTALKIIYLDADIDGEL